MAKLTVAVLSDLHCQRLEQKKRKAKKAIPDKKESLLIVGEPRSPEKRHPVQALSKLVREKGLSSDVIMCAGDITNKASREGLAFSWYIIKEIKEMFSASQLLCTLGNHDIDSQHIYEEDPFKMAREIYPSFPFLNETQANSYWDRGYSICVFPERALVLTINSAADHNTESKAKRGCLSLTRLENMERRLSEFSTRGDLPIRVALLHHHPVLHTGYTNPDTDVLENGDRLLEMLSLNKFSLVVHGHRHDPRIRRYSYSGNGMIILASGSFSAVLPEEISTNTRNLFHLIDLEDDGHAVQMTIRSWEFNYDSGWNPSTSQSAKLKHNIRCKSQYQATNLDEMRDYFNKIGADLIDVRDFERNFSEIEYYLPDEIAEVAREFESRHRIRINFGRNDEIASIGKILE